MRAGVLGLGIGRHHAALLATMPGVELVAMCQAHETDPPLDVLAQRVGARAYRSVEEMFADAALDLVCICTRPSAHAASVRAAVAANVAMLIEKPLAGSELDALSIADFIRSTGAWAAVNFEMRWLPPVQRLKTLLRDGYLGRPIFVELSYVIDAARTDSWVWHRDEGRGPLWENTCHAYDLVRYLLGEVELRASTAANLLGAETTAPDFATVTLRNRDGVLANVVGGAIGTPERGAPIRLEVYGSDGYAALSGGFHTLASIAYARSGERVCVEGTPPDGEAGPRAVASLLRPGLERVVADLTQGRRPSTTVDDAVAAANLCAQVMRGYDDPK